MSFSSRNIVIVGASSGIGEALFHRLKPDGAHLTTLGRREVADADRHLDFDVESEDVVPELPEVIHGLVYCPGTIFLKPFHRLREEDFLRDWKINFQGAVKVLQAALPSLKKADGGSVVLFSTVAVGTGLGFHASIASAKGAVEGLVRSLACEWAPQVRVNAIAPALTETPLAGGLLGSVEKREAAAARHPLKRVGTAEEVAALTEMLLRDESASISGQILRPDGGLSSIRPMV